MRSRGDANEKMLRGEVADRVRGRGSPPTCSGIGCPSVNVLLVAPVMAAGLFCLAHVLGASAQEEGTKNEAPKDEAGEEQAPNAPQAEVPKGTDVLPEIKVNAGRKQAPRRAVVVRTGPATGNPASAGQPASAIPPAGTPTGQSAAGQPTAAQAALDSTMKDIDQSRRIC